MYLVWFNIHEEQLSLLLAMGMKCLQPHFLSLDLWGRLASPPLSVSSSHHQFAICVLFLS